MRPAMPARESRKHPHLRIVSLAPSVTSILWAIGARRQVVGVSKWCPEVAAVGRLPRVGDCWAADPAEIARLRPSLLIGSVPFQPEMVARLLELGVPLLATNPRSLADVYADIHLLGRIAGRSSAATAAVLRMRRDLQRIATRAGRKPLRTAHGGSPPQPSVYAEAWPNPRISSPPWVSELITIAGGCPVLPAGQKVTDEQVAAARPDVIILAWTATGAKADPQRTLENPAWRDVPAICHRRVHVIRDELLNTPSPILVRGALELSRVIHPAHPSP